MGEPVETLLALYKEQTEQARHHEDQRATMTNYVLVVAGSVLGLVSVDGFRSAQAALGCFLFVVGCFGAAVSAKHYERNRITLESLGNIGVKSRVSSQKCPSLAMRFAKSSKEIIRSFRESAYGSIGSRFI